MTTIIFCTNSTGILGGKEKIFADKLNYLIANTQFDIRIVTRNQESKQHYYPLNIQDDKCYDLGIDYDNITNKNPILRLIKRIYMSHIHGQRLSRIINRLSPDIVIINSPEDVLVIDKLPRSVQIIYEEHNLIGYFTNKLLKHTKSGLSLKISLWKLMFDNYRFKYKLKEIDLIICLTKNAKRYHSIEKNNIKVLANPLGEEFRVNSIIHKQKKIIAVGRLSPEKRFHLFIEACNLIKIKARGWTFHIYGDGPEYYKLKEQIDELGIQKIIFIHRNSSDMVQIFQEAAICVITSLYESYCMVLVEAMSQQVACVSFSINMGPVEIIKNNYNGILVNDGDTLELSDAILNLVENDQLRKTIGVNGKTFTNTLFTNNIMPKYLSLLGYLNKP